MLNIIKEIYKNVKYCIRINGLHTNWFNVGSGLKQGCILSPLRFNLYINDLAETVKALNIGINVAGEKVSLLLYADDLVLLAENELALQELLNALNSWCITNKISINEEKSKVVHFRTKSVSRSSFDFNCGNTVLEITSAYNYLGVMLTEFLDFDIMSRNVAKSASRALGLVIYKSKLNGGFSFRSFSKLYDALGWPIIDYGSCIWGTSRRSCIEAVQNRAGRFFMA